MWKSEKQIPSEQNFDALTISEKNFLAREATEKKFDKTKYPALPENQIVRA